MDIKLLNYRKELEEECKNNVPNFCKHASTKNAKILALLQDPGNSGAEKTETCSVWKNNDPTSMMQLKFLKKYELDKKKNEILFWNFYGCFDLTISKMKKNDNLYWLTKVKELLALCPKIKVIIVFGVPAWKGMYYFYNKSFIKLVPAPHPSKRGMTQYNAEIRLDSAWKIAKDLIKS